VLAHDDAGVDPGVAGRVRADLAERARGVPLAYLIGTREFHGLTLQVGPAVLVPRPETETLVDWALEVLPVDVAAAADVVDLGTGSGAIALAVKAARPAACVTATDVSAAALAVACANAGALGLAVEFVEGYWWAPLAGRRFDLALCNPPYIDAADRYLSALHAEPQAALTPGVDGLTALRAVIGQAGDHLRPGAALLVEHGHEQGSAVRSLLLRNGFESVQTRRDLAGQERVTGGHRTDRSAAA
jgi:release factor glutamine methyltransferase